MKVCIPVIEDKGLQSEVCEHFGSAPIFLIVDIESGTCDAVANRNEHHAHGMCQPLKSLSGKEIGAIVVGGIGLGALLKLKAANIEVFLSHLSTVEETINALKANSLRKVTEKNACGHHNHHHGGGH